MIEFLEKLLSLASSIIVLVTAIITYKASKK